jgi:type I restriction enzyme S subunit
MSPFNETRYRELLEGLEINIRLKSEAFNLFYKSRIDPEFFQKNYIALETKVTKKEFDILGEIAFVTDGEHGTAKTYETGYSKYFGARNVLTGILNDNNVDFISKEHHEKLKKTALKPRDVLISCVGANIGYSAIVPDNIGIGNIVRNVALIRSTSSYLNEYLHAYFLSKYGKQLYYRMNSGNAQPLVSLDYIKTISIFKPSSTFQDNIKKVISESLFSIDNSKQTYVKADDLLIKAVGLQNFEPTKEAINIKNLSESFEVSGRLDAEYYQPKYEDYENLVVSQKHTFIRAEYLHITDKSKRDKKGYNYIEIGDVNVGDGSNKSNYITTQDLPANAKTLVKKGDILISNVRPYRGAVTIINSDLDDLIVSGAFTVLRRDSNSVYNNQVLQVLLRTSVYKDWLLKFNVGTSYPVIKDNDVLNLPIPFIDTEKQKQIAELIKESSALKKQSEFLLEVAKNAVEIAIEQDEKTALDYINAKTNANAS